MNSFTRQDNKTLGAGSFQTAIMKSIRLADYSNLVRLYKGFTKLVIEYLDYMGNDKMIEQLKGVK